MWNVWLRPRARHGLTAGRAWLSLMTDGDQQPMLPNGLARPARIKFGIRAGWIVKIRRAREGRAERAE